MSELKRCTNCTLPETHETIYFDEEGKCNVCKQIEFKKQNIDWEKKEQDLLKILDNYRGKYDYDCLVPFSGGKDSTWTLYVLMKKYNLRPLVMSFDHGFYRPTVEENKRNVFRALGCDVLKFTPNWHVVRKLMLEALQRKGDFCWHCHTGIFSYPMHVAIKYNIPLVIWGEPSAEYTSYYTYEDEEAVDEERFNMVTNLGITAQDMIGMIGDSITEKDLIPFTYPKEKDLRKLKYRSFCLGSYIPWDTKKQSEIIMKEVGWRGEEVEGVPEEFNFEKIECAMQGVRDYLKYIKRGFARTSHLTSLEIRHGRMKREKAMELIKEYEGKRPASLDVFLGYVGITEEQFNEIAVSHWVYPNEIDPTKLEKGKPNWDQPLWYHQDGGGMTTKELMLEYNRLKEENEALKRKLESK